MKFFVCLVTPDEQLRRFAGRAKDGLVPAEVGLRGPLAGLKPRFTSAAWSPEPPETSASLGRFLLSRARDHDGCILVVDSRWAHYVADIGNAAFVVQFDVAGADGNPQNFFAGLLARALRNFAQLLAKFRRGNDAQLLHLPLRNFRAAEIAEIARICRDEPLSGDLSNNIERQLKGLRARVRPRRKSSYKTEYAVDDARRFFIYGPERHAQFATGDPHRPYCEFTGLFRFGVRIDERRHYNVSETEGDRTKISGEFIDCHGESRVAGGVTHLNMFTNDYF